MWYKIHDIFLCLYIQVLLGKLVYDIFKAHIFSVKVANIAITYLSSLLGSDKDCHIRRLISFLCFG